MAITPAIPETVYDVRGVRCTNGRRLPSRLIFLILAAEKINAYV